MSERILNENGKQIKSLNTAFDIVERIGDWGGGTVSELAEELDYSKSSIHYYLQTMEKRRYVVREGNTYHVGLQFLNIGGHALARNALPSAVKDEVDKLMKETGETAIFTVEEHGKTVCIYRTLAGEPESPQLGEVENLHCTAFGKAIMAYLPEAYRSNIIERYGLERVTDQTITEQDELSEELRKIRKNGVAFDDEEHNPGFRSVAAPILENESDNVYGAVGIVGSADAIDDPQTHLKAQRFTKRHSNIVKQTANVVRSKLN